ncbi:unnamed protein product [Vitrella brassicaformis CCMP3155]|uniref:Succinate dehydrogenase assembly factor 2, mitochondrial n=1 Tax=Vitrella brassicaformis (strain CCMP3155) TaxID=1169540 RepID=A0A0G4EE25_VITBC|nr:unnamed protein product [Vitrella brassicaformis CCMP3155]|eukprot:CEL93813.1 unnamed protein product [Vitrella brassicaformis CCMP3155]
MSGFARRRLLLNQINFFRTRFQPSFGGRMAVSEKEREAEMQTRHTLLQKSKQRGFLELDRLLGSFADSFIWTLSEHQLTQFESLLAMENPQLFSYISGQQPVPAELRSNEVMQLMLSYVNANHPSGRRYV